MVAAGFLRFVFKGKCFIEKIKMINKDSLKNNFYNFDIQSNRNGTKNKHRLQSDT
jgi:hypothetical protein